MTRTFHRAVPVLLLVALGLVASGACADVYKYRDAYGRIHLTDQRMSGNVVLLKVFRMARSSSDDGGAALLQQRRSTYAPMISRIAREQRLHPELLEGSRSDAQPHDHGCRWRPDRLQLRPG